MEILVEYNGTTQPFEAHEGDTVLDVLQLNGIPVRATCGGVGRCRKCQVMIRDSAGLRYELACEQRVSDNMLVVVGDTGTMDVVEEGSSIGFEPDEGAEGLGVAIDIGTTTLAAHLHDLGTGTRLASASRPNPQIAFGADVISRISASVDGKLPQMTALIVDAMVDMRDQLLEGVHAGAQQSDTTAISIAGNTTMQHIAAGMPPDSIGVNPFIPLSLFGDEREIEGLGTCYFAPCIAGYVGGDITAGLLARGFDDGHTRLLMDLGTNGEMALSHGGRIACCATAAGPVFEGANVRFGMPAGPGAISQVKWEDGRVVTTIIGQDEPIGICGTGIIDAIALMVEAGIVDETGYLLDADDVDEEYADWLGEESDANVFYLTEDHSLFITQTDVRSMQLAKAAVCAGVHTLMDACGIDGEDIEAVEIAGGFGKYLNLASAARIGLFPPELEDRAASVGNTSAEGASALVISHAARERADRIVDLCDYLELSTSSVFNDFYIEMMEFE